MSIKLFLLVMSVLYRYKWSKDLSLPEDLSLSVSRLTSHSRMNELMQIDIKNLEHKIDLLDTKVDMLENNIREVGQAVIEGQGFNEEEF